MKVKPYSLNIHWDKRYPKAGTIDLCPIQLAVKAVSSRSSLTMREKEVLQLLVNGYTCPQISEKIFLIVGTVMNYHVRILLKLDVNNSAALVKKALQLGLAE